MVAQLTRTAFIKEPRECHFCPLTIRDRMATILHRPTTTEANTSQAKSFSTACKAKPNASKLTKVMMFNELSFWASSV